MYYKNMENNKIETAGAYHLKYKIAISGAAETEFMPPELMEKVAAIVHVNPGSIVNAAIEDRLNYLEWKEKAIAEGQADLNCGRVISTGQLRESLANQRAQRGATSKKAA